MYPNVHREQLALRLSYMSTLQKKVRGTVKGRWWVDTKTEAAIREAAEEDRRTDEFETWAHMFTVGPFVYVCPLRLQMCPSCMRAANEDTWWTLFTRSWCSCDNANISWTSSTKQQVSFQWQINLIEHFLWRQARVGNWANVLMMILLRLLLWSVKDKILVESEKEWSKADEHYEGGDEIDDGEKKVLRDFTNS